MGKDSTDRADLRLCLARGYADPEFMTEARVPIFEDIAESCVIPLGRFRSQNRGSYVSQGRY